MTILRSDNGSPGLVRGGGAGGVNCCTRREEDAKSSIPEDEDAEEDDVEVICPFALVLIVINPPLDAQGTGGAVCLSWVLAVLVEDWGSVNWDEFAFEVIDVLLKFFSVRYTSGRGGFTSSCDGAWEEDSG